MKIQVGEIFEINSKKYIIKDRINSGGNSTVWKAEVNGDFQIYAIKVLNNVAKFSRFERECEFCKTDNNIHIIRVFEYIIKGNNAYCIMPYYSRNLRNIIDTEHDSFVLLDYIIQLCEAISFIHKKGIIHRDLKPENILVSDDNTLVLTDFGIAHFQDSLATKQREWLGNRRYAAPEQLATDEVSVACDIYSLGRIMNELFTKQNPSGESFMTISEKIPLLLPLDRIVKKCRTQDPRLRPSIDDILMELYLFEGEIKEKLSKISQAIYPTKKSAFSEKKNAIILQAAKDVLSAQNIFEKTPDEKLNELNVNYHQNLLYDMKKPIQNLLLQKRILDCCSRKFNYEAVPYNNGNSYKALNLDDNTDTALYKALNDILEDHKIPANYKNITAQIKKIFCSCCRYHCIELLDSIKKECKRESPLFRAPILYIVYFLRTELPKEDLNNIIFSEQITINLESKVDEQNDQSDYYYVPLYQEELKILSQLKQHYDVTYSYADDKHFYVRFQTIDAFEKFKEFALELSQPYYVFEGDVKKVIRIRRNYHGIVELEPLDSFDVMNTLAKILGIRTDY